MYNAITLSEGGDKGKKPAPPPLSQDELQKFGNWANTTDNKEMAADLMNRGLQGADQLLYDNPDTKSASGIRNAQSDWKLAAIQNILANARKYNLRTPEEVMANKNVLVDNPKWKEAINNPNFSNIHPNFWQTITHSILPEQWSKYDASKNVIATK